MLEPERALELAAEETRRRIEEDLRRTPASLHPLLREIQRGLFSDRLTVSTLKRKLRASNRLMQQFRTSVGLTATDYLNSARMETAARMLRDTDLEISDVSMLVGFPEPVALRNAFRRWLDLRPTEFRRQVRKVSAGAGESTEEMLSLRPWHNLKRDTLNSEQIQNLNRWFQSAYPTVEWTAKAAALAGEDLESCSAALLVELADLDTSLPHSARLQILRQEVRLDSPGLFELLSEQSRLQGRQDRRRGIELAELALASLEGSADALGEQYSDLAALGWARLGQARQLDLDRDGAQTAFLRASELWSTPRTLRDRTVKAEILALEGTLRLHQRRFDEARQLLHQAIAICWAENALHLLIRSLIQRAAIADYLGDHAAAIRDLEATLQLLDEQEDTYATLAACVNLATSYAWVGKPHKAQEFLPRARQLALELDNRLIQYQLRWIEGLIHLANQDTATAEDLFRRARTGLLRLGELDHAAVVSLELALICHHQERIFEAISLAAEAIPVLKAFQANPEAVTALRLLSQAVSSNAITRAILKRIRKSLLTISRDPTTTSPSQNRSYRSN